MTGFSQLIRCATLAVATLLLACGSAWAQSIVSSGQSFITPRLLPGSITPDGGRMAGLRLSMEAGWKTYWRSPGETGIPPRFDWSASRNIRTVKIHWPRPVLFESFGMRTAGYADVVLFPLEVEPIDPARSMHLSLSAELGVCKDICVLENVRQTLEIAPQDAEIGARQIRSALRRVPGPASTDMLRIDACKIAGQGRDRLLTVVFSHSDALSKPVALLESDSDIWIRDTRQTRTPDGLQLEADIRLPDGVTWIDRSAFRITLLSQFEAYDLQGCRAG